jgi:hypothetical protein
MEQIQLQPLKSAWKYWVHSKAMKHDGKDVNEIMEEGG